MLYITTVSEIAITGGSSSTEEHIINMYEAMDSIHSTEKRRKGQRKERKKEGNSLLWDHFNHKCRTNFKGTGKNSLIHITIKQDFQFFRKVHTQNKNIK